MRDMKEKGRARGAGNQGAGQEQTRLTPQQVVEIYESTKQNVVLSVEYDVNTKTIYEIKSGKTWRKLTNGLVKGVPEFRVPAGFKLVPINESAATVPQAPQVVQAPLGWKLVPIEPTPVMRKAAADAWLDCGSKMVLNKAASALIAGIVAAPDFTGVA